MTDGWVASAVLALALAAGQGQAAVVHDDGATDFTGTYRGVGSFEVPFLARAGQGTIAFDIFGARSVDGDNAWADLFSVALNGVTLFTGSFSMSGGGGNVVRTNLFGWTASTFTNPGGYFQGGLTRVAGQIALLEGQNRLAFGFAPLRGGNQGKGDESWAINRVEVSSPAPVPLPAALPLLGLATAALAAAAIRRRHRARR